MRFTKEVNIYAPDAILKRFKANETNFSVLQGKVSSLISESEIKELRNGNITMYSKLSSVEQTADGLTQKYTDISSKYNAVAQQYSDIDSKVSSYKSSVDGLSANISAVSTNLRDNYSTTSAMNTAIEAKANSVLTTVSSTYAKNDRVGALETWKKSAEQKITADAIVSTVTSSTDWSDLKTRVSQTETSLSTKVSKGSIISQINQTAEKIHISASKISLEGLVTANKYFKIDSTGAMQATSGTIGGWIIGDTTIKSKNKKITLDSKAEKITTVANNKNFSTTIEPGTITTGDIYAPDGGKIGGSKANNVYSYIVIAGMPFTDSGSVPSTVININESLHVEENGVVMLFDLDHVTSGGHVVFKADGASLAYSASSSRRYKNHVSDMTIDDAAKILDIPVVWFKYKDGYLSKDDPMVEKSIPGLYAEDVARFFPAAAFTNEKGQIENWNERMIIPAMLKLIQDLYAKVNS